MSYFQGDANEPTSKQIDEWHRNVFLFRNYVSDIIWY